MSSLAVWVIRAGKNGEASDLFLKENFLAIGWAEVGNLSELEPTRLAFRNKLAACHPDKSFPAIRTNADQLYKFVHEIQVNDIVIYPSKLNRELHVGRVLSAYLYSTNFNPMYPHLRKVTWLRTIQRSQLTQQSLQEIGSILTLFRVKNTQLLHLVHSE